MIVRRSAGDISRAVFDDNNNIKEIEGGGNRTSSCPSLTTAQIIAVGTQQSCIALIILRALRHVPFSVSWQASPAFRPQRLPRPLTNDIEGLQLIGVRLTYLASRSACQETNMLPIRFKSQPDLLAQRGNKGVAAASFILYGRERSIPMASLPFSIFFQSWPTTIRAYLTANKQPRQSQSHGAHLLFTPTTRGQG